MPRVPEIEIEEGKWSDWFSARKNFTQICCCCGLSHAWQFRFKDGNFYLRVKENKRSTAAARRKKGRKNK